MSKLCVPRSEAMEAMQFLGIDDPSWPEFAAWAVEHDIYPRLNGCELTIRYSDISVGDWVTITGSSGWSTRSMARKSSTTSICRLMRRQAPTSACFHSQSLTRTSHDS